MIGSVASIFSKVDRKLRVVVVDNFYDTIETEWVQHFIGKLISFKINSYRKEYPYGILPFGSHDVVGTHLLLCEDGEQGLKPLMGYKLITLRQCQKFFLDFPIFSVLNDPETEVHKKAVEDEIERCNERGCDIGYMGSWTIRPDIRKNKILTKICYDVSSAFIVWSSFHYNIEVGFTIASLRFRVEKFHQLNGMFRLKYNQQTLPDFHAKSFFNEPSCISHFIREQLSESALKKAEFYRDLWDNRIVISEQEEQIEKKTA